MAATPVRVAVRWKLLAAFAGAFTLVFGFIAVWAVENASKTALEQVTLQLTSAATGVARIIDPEEFEQLVTTVPAVPDPSLPGGLGYPPSPLYVSVADALRQLTDVVPESQPYSYFRDAGDGQLYFAASAGYFGDPQYGVTFRQPVREVSEPDTRLRMAEGLGGTVVEPPYTDAFGSWVSVYTPILSSTGGSVGAVGVDYPLDYVQSVEKEARAAVFPILGAAYLALLLLVLLVSTMVVRPLRRLTDATQRIADGEYELDVRSLVHSRFPDELYELGESFQVMAAKVAAREKSLTSEVQRLRVQIDHQKREQAVKEITETDFFADLEAKAATLRARMHEPDPPEVSESPDEPPAT
ncbi:MAG: HAMP domain-containing protein [Actinobacteria bacterium]|nr:HAMP domain-containing protein [Actinomycetota bacterium]